VRHVFRTGRGGIGFFVVAWKRRRVRRAIYVNRSLVKENPLFRKKEEETYRRGALL